MLLVAITGTEAITTPNQIHKELALTSSTYMRSDTARASPCRKILSDWGTNAPTVITEATVPIWLARSALLNQLNTVSLGPLTLSGTRASPPHR